MAVSVQVVALVVVGLLLLVEVQLWVDQECPTQDVHLQREDWDPAQVQSLVLLEDVDQEQVPILQELLVEPQVVELVVVVLWLLSSQADSDSLYHVCVLCPCLHDGT